MSCGGLCYSSDMSTQNPSDAEKHFAFGANWAAYAKLVGEPEIEEAEKGLRELR